MLQKTKAKVQELSGRSIPYVKQMRDVRMIGLLIFAGIALLVTWSGVSVIQTNYELQQRISRLEQENELQNLENKNKQLKNQYYKTDQYLELQARKQFSKATPGETLILVPESVALAHSKDLPEEKSTEATESKPAKPAYQRNFEAWMEFIFRRNARKI